MSLTSSFQDATTEEIKFCIDLLIDHLKFPKLATFAQFSAKYADSKAFRSHNAPFPKNEANLKEFVSKLRRKDVRTWSKVIRIAKECGNYLRTKEVSPFANMILVEVFSGCESEIRLVVHPEEKRDAMTLITSDKVVMLNPIAESDFHAISAK